MIIDAHHHLWKFNKDDYAWMGESMSILKQDYLPADLEEQLCCMDCYKLINH
jgi:L-fuconolactonase